MVEAGGEDTSGEQYYYQQEQRRRYDSDQRPPPYYGTFPGNPNYPPPPGYSPHPSHPFIPSTPYQYPPDLEVAEGRPAHGPYQHFDRLPFCGLGVGWFLFILGFICISLSWFIGAFIFFCLRYDPRERVGLAACTITALIALIVGTRVIAF